jgi:hypothetical protein
MHRTRLLPTTVAIIFLVADFTAAMALPVAPNATAKATGFSSSSDTQLVRGGRGGGFRGGGVHAGGARGGFHGGRGMVAHRGYGVRGGGMYAGRGYGRGRGYGWGAAAAATGLGVAAATAPYWGSGYNCGPYQHYQSGYGCVNQ